jgi:hypothetical protein
MTNLALFRYLGMTVTNQNLVQVEIKDKESLGHPSYHSVQNLLSSHLLSKNLDIGIYKVVILSALLFGCET